MRTALVTGGTVRLGRAIAERLRADGWRVLTSSHRADADADIVADLSLPMGAEELHAAALRLLGGMPPDALVNNAALFAGDEAILRAVNCEAPRTLTRLMAERSEGVGVVVNVIDCKALGEPRATDTPYLRSKRALYAETLDAARRFAPTLRVNAVAPGPVLAPTDVHAKAGRLLLARRPSVEDVAAAVAYLLDAQTVTAVCLPVDSGQHLLGD